MPGLVGESGSGKTATGFPILGLVDPPGRIDSGSIKLDGEELVGKPEDALHKVRHRIESYWQPYHAALRALLDTVQASAGVVYHLNLHSVHARANAMHEDAFGSLRPDIVLSGRQARLPG